MGNQQTPHGGSVNRERIRLIIAASTLEISDGTIEADCTAGNMTLTLLSAGSCKGWSFTIKKVDNTAFALTLDAEGFETIDGSQTYSISTINDEVTIQSDGVSWNITGFYNTKADPNTSDYAGFFPGMIVAYGGTVAPVGWDLCDGASKLRAGSYAKLFAAIGTAFGTADGTHFNLPDFRGRFLRMVDGAAGRDPDDAARTAMNAGGNAADNVGSVQGFATAAPTIPFTVPTDNAAGADPASVSEGVAAAATQAVSGGDAETRPINAYVNYIIKR